MTLLSRLTTALFLLTVIACLPRTSPAQDSQPASPAKSVLRFKLADPTEIPGRTLQPGAYTLRVVDHLSDRMILRISQPSGGKETTFLAVPAPTSAADSGSGPALLIAGANAKAALRGFNFPDGTSAEIVYPKADAIALAKANNTKILAVDPVSDGMKAGINSISLTPEQMQVVTLWVLTPTPIGPDASGPGIQAKRYESPNGAAPKARPTLLASLPHTASTIPLFYLAGLLSLAGAAFLTLRRLSHSV